MVCIISIVVKAGILLRRFAMRFEQARLLDFPIHCANALQHDIEFPVVAEVEQVRHAPAFREWQVADAHFGGVRRFVQVWSRRRCASALGKEISVTDFIFMSASCRADGIALLCYLIVTI